MEEEESGKKIKIMDLRVKTIICLMASVVKVPERVKYFEQTLRSIQNQERDNRIHFQLYVGLFVAPDLRRSVNDVKESFRDFIFVDQQKESLQFDILEKMFKLACEEHPRKPLFFLFSDDDDLWNTMRVSSAADSISDLADALCWCPPDGRSYVVGTGDPTSAAEVEKIAEYGRFSEYVDALYSKGILEKFFKLLNGRYTPVDDQILVAFASTCIAEGRMGMWTSEKWLYYYRKHSQNASKTPLLRAMSQLTHFMGLHTPGMDLRRVLEEASLRGELHSFVEAQRIIGPILESLWLHFAKGVREEEIPLQNFVNSLFGVDWKQVVHAAFNEAHYEVDISRSTRVKGDFVVRCFKVDPERLYFYCPLCSRHDLKVEHVVDSDGGLTYGCRGHFSFPCSSPAKFILWVTVTTEIAVQTSDS